jgi:hypothetical protein
MTCISSKRVLSKFKRMLVITHIFEQAFIYSMGVATVGFITLKPDLVVLQSQ